MLPFVESLNSYFVPALRDFQKKLIDENWIGKMKEIAEDVGNFIVGVGKVANAIIDTLGVGGTLATILGGTVFFNAAKWYAQGVQLGLGFNTVAGKGGMGSMFDMLPGGKKMRVGAKMMKSGRVAKGASTLLKGGGKFAAPLAIAGLGLDAYSNLNDDKLSTGEAIGKTADQNKFMLAGAGIGATLGGIFGLGAGAVPGAVIGAGIGGIADFAASFMDNEGLIGDYPVDDAIIKFNPQDKIVSMDDGLVASTSKGKIDELVQGRGTKKQKIEFGKLDIGGKITLEMPGGTVADIDLTREPEFVRKLSTMIQEQLRTNLAGGKLSPNPIPRYDN